MKTYTALLETLSYTLYPVVRQYKRILEILRYSVYRVSDLEKPKCRPRLDIDAPLTERYIRDKCELYSVQPYYI